MNLSDVLNRIESKVARVEVVGDENGDLMVVVRQGEFSRFITNKNNGQIKRFREPKTLSNYLSKKGVSQYSVQLKEWDVSMIFDRHKAATLLRSK